MDFSKMFGSFDSIFKGSTKKRKKENTRDTKKTNCGGKKVNIAEDANGNSIEAYWDDNVAKIFANRRLANILSSLHANY